MRQDSRRIDVARIALVPSGDLMLEPFEASHFSTLASWFESERDVVQWGGPAVHHPLDAAQLQTMLPDTAARPSHLAWMAVAHHAYVGHAQVISLDPRTGVARLGRIVIAPEHRGRGLVDPMLGLVIAEAFAEPSTTRVDLGVYTWNITAIKAYQRLGFRAGAVRHAATTIGAEQWDAQEMSLPRAAHPLS